MHWILVCMIQVQDLAVSLYCILEENIHSHSASLHLGVEMSTGKLLGKPDEMWGVTL